jgi:putative addiction module component (TIGR02574 family)
MNERVKTIFEAAQKLPPAEREELAELLMATIDVDPGIEKAWADEIEGRIAAHERGELSARPAEEVLAKYLKT